MVSQYVQQLMVDCGSGRLQARIRYAQQQDQGIGVILCPPHPLLAGNMENNVITALSRRLAREFPVLTFNYRAVGRSFSPEPDLPLFEYWNRLDQSGDFSSIIRDTRGLLAWSRRLFSAVHLAGYSFGSFIALSAMTVQTLSLSVIAPPLAEHDFSGLPSLELPVLMVAAEQDNLLAVADVPIPEISHRMIKGSDHFFVGREEEVADQVAVFLKGLPSG